MEEVKTLEDLRRGNFAQRPLAVVGCPVAHSLSPLMHNAMLSKLAENDPAFKDWHYYKFEIAPQDIAEAAELFAEKKFVGMNFTLPHKLLTPALCKEADGEVRLIGAANTLENIGGGWKAHNTDGYGLEKALESSLGAGLEGARLVLLGAGGAARAAAFYASGRKIKSLTIFNRGAPNLERLLSDLRARGFAAEGKILDGAPEGIAEGSIVVNCASVGIKESDPPVADFSKLPPGCVFFDMAYRSGAQTASVISARKLGIRAESGLAMLAWQGAKALEIWTKRKIDAEFMLDCLRARA